MTRLTFHNAEIARQFGAYHYTGDDGYPAALVVDEVFVETDDAEYVIPNVRWASDPDTGWRFPRRLYDPVVALAAIKAKGDFDPEHWVLLEKRVPLEERFAQYAYEEAQERAGFQGGLYR